MTNESYLGNVNVKRDGVEQQWDAETIREYTRCLKDPAYFIKNYIKVISLDEGLVPFNLYDYQEKMIKHFDDNRFSIVLAIRQSGKCQSINSTIQIKHRGTNEQYTFTFGEFEQLLSSNIGSDYRGVKSQVSPETSSLENPWGQRHSAVRFDLRAEQREACGSKNVWAQERTRDLSSEYGNWDHLSDLWNLYQEQNRSTYPKVSSEELPKLQWRTLLRFIEREVFGKSDWREQSMVQSWWEIQSLLERICELFGRSKAESCRESFIQYTLGLLPRQGHDGAGGSRSSLQKTTNLLIGEVLRTIWAGRIQNLQSTPGEVAGNIEFEAPGRNRPDSNGKIDWKNESTLQFRSTSKSHSGIGLCDQIDKTRYTGRILEGGYNFQNCNQQILETRNCKEWNTPRNSTCPQNDILRRLQIRARNSSKEQVDKNNIERDGNVNNGSIYQGTRLSDTVERKFIESFSASDYLIWTDTGWEKLESLNKTVKYEKYFIQFDDGSSTEVADTHIFFDSKLNEVFAKDSLNVAIYGELKNKTVTTVIPTGIFENMYDVSINSENHRYYSDGVLSHNSVTSCAYLLWAALFQPEQTVAILANKGATAKEMLGRITLMLENLPFFLQPGCKSLNKTSIEFSNNSKILSSATSSSSIRGLSCVPDYINVEVCEGNDVQTLSIKNAQSLYNSSDKQISIRTPNGFKKFEGFISQGKVNKLLRIHFTNNESIDCTYDHRFLTNDSVFQRAESLKENDILYNDFQICLIETLYYDDGIEVFDAYNVKDDHSYITNGVVSHNCNLIFLDEFAFVQNDAEFYTSTYPVISSGKNTKIIITSTPNGLGNVFHKLWEGAVQNTNNFAPFTINWWDVPGRDEKWKQETIANTSEMQFRQEYMNCIEGSSKVTVLMDNIVYQIEIGELYNAIERETASNLSLNEEVRRSAIRWYYYTGQDSE